MKKTTAILLSMVLCMGIFASIPTSLATDNGVVFELNLDSFNADGAATSVDGIVDSTGNASAISLAGTSLQKGVFENINGNTKKYLDMRSGALQVDSQAVIQSMDDMTVEAWAKLNMTSNDWANLFAIGENTVREQVNMRLTWYQWAGRKILVYKGAPAASGMVEGYFTDNLSLENRWAHYVFTRKWDSSVNKWTITGYADGNLIMNETVDGVNSAPINSLLNIGWQALDGKPLGGDMGDFRVYNRAFTAQEASAAYNNTKDEYTAAIDSMLLADVTGTINVNSGKLTVEFNNFIKASTLEGNITFTDLYGEPVKGGAYVAVDTNNTKKAIVSFGKLEEGLYKLDVKSGLTSKNNIAAAAGTFYINVTDGVLLNEDFNGSDYVVGQNPPTDKGINYENPNYITVREENGDKYIKLLGEPNTLAYKMFDTPITNGVYAVDLKVRPNSDLAGRGKGTMPRDAFRMIYETNLYSEVASMASGHMVFNDNLYSRTVDLPVKETGFYNLRYILKQDTDGIYIAEIYNLDDPSWGPFVFKDSNVLKQKSYLKGILASHIYPWGSDSAEQLLYDSAELSEFKIYSIIEPKALHVGEYNAESSSIDVVFNDDINPSDITSDNVYVVNDNNIIIPSVPSYNANTRTLTMAFGNGSELKGNYQIIYQNVNTMGGTKLSQPTDFSTPVSGLTAAKGIYKDQNGQIVNALEGVTSLTASVNITNNDISGSSNCMFVLAVYEGNKLQGINIVPYTVQAQQTIEGTATINGITATSNTKAKVFVWNNLADLQPISGANEISFVPGL